MKNEIIVTEDQRSLIVEIFNSKLTEAEQDLLSACCILCTYGVSKRDIQQVLDLEPSVLCTQIDALLHEGVLVSLGSDIIFAPDEVKKTVLPIHPVPISIFNRIVEKLTIHIVPSIYVDSLEVKPYFDMAEGLVDYVVEYSLEKLDWKSFANLVSNYAFQYESYGRIEIGIHQKSELLVIRALELTRTKVRDSKKLYNKLTILEAQQYINGFFYRQAKVLLEEVGASELKSELPLYLLVKGEFYMTWGEQFQAFSYFFKAYQESLINGDDFDLGFLRSYISMILAYMCASTNDQASARRWQNKVHWSAIPSHNIISIYFHLTNGMLASGHLAETELTLAEKEITDVNPDALVLARAYYCWSRYYANLGQARRSSHFYLCYTRRIARFGSTEGADLIFKVGEILRMLSENCLLTAQRLLNELDRVDLKSEDLALSVRLACTRAYAECLAAIGQLNLSTTYCDIGLTLLNESQPKQDVIKTAANVFNGGKFPSSLSETAFYFTSKKINNKIEEIKRQAVQPGCLSRDTNIFKSVWEEIKRQKGCFPQYRTDMDIVGAYIVSLTKPQHAVKWLLKLVNKAEGEEKIRVALSAANYCSEIGYYWEEKKILELAADNFAFQEANEGLQIALLIELANVTEIAGFRTTAARMWEELIALTQGTELESKVLFLYAVNACDYEDYSKAEILIDRSVACYQQEESCVDETFASLLAYRSVILSGMGRFSEAKTVILDAMKYYPDLNNKSSFNLWYNLCWYCIAIQEDSAREALAKAKSLWGIGENEKAQIDELYDILRQPKEERGKYFQTSLDSEP